MGSEKLKKYSITVSKTISVLASDEDTAKEIAIDDFDCTDLDCEVNDEQREAININYTYCCSCWTMAAIPGTQTKKT